MKIPFNRPYLAGKEIDYLIEAHAMGRLAGDGSFTQKCNEKLRDLSSSIRALLTHSCTAALEMAAILFDVERDDEIIMPSYTFVSTANAFVLRGGRPVFVDIRPDTLNINEELIEQAITPRTKAIAVVHYAGVAAEMDQIMLIAEKHGLWVLEDAAQGILSTYKRRALGSIGHLGAYSFHETKNVISGEGGALLINDGRFIERAEVIREKGTNRSRFFRGEIDKYTWEDIGSSYLPGEIIAAFLWAQLEVAEFITENRVRLWSAYHDAMRDLESASYIQRPSVPEYCTHNGHLYYILVESEARRSRILDALKDSGVGAVFHYVPLHSAPAGLRFGRTSGEMNVTNDIACRLIRLPIWIGMREDEQNRVIELVDSAVRG